MTALRMIYSVFGQCSSEEPDEFSGERRHKQTADDTSSSARSAPSNLRRPLLQRKRVPRNAIDSWPRTKTPSPGKGHELVMRLF